ncbi:MAG TPA: EamA family transporter [Candidatus Nanoarchaeia archaeon]|uniref:DMT family transporter n=1 Tax=Candidatus Iainarchaeum sp. TaxID=3101447 RepID=A0A8T4KRN7_9ARCH|nr:DMT family transporter [Candidatus Diapherotrites archaeon]HLD18399.1 EamA family transporter [Candidatus Nanoarchaeia archaeon]
MISLGIIFAIGSLICWGTADYVQKLIFGKINVKQLLFWSAPLNIIITAAFFPFFWEPTSFPLSSIIFAIVTGILNGLGLIFFLTALSKDKLSLVTSIGSAYPVITIILGIIILRENLSSIEGIGIAIVMIGVIAAGFVHTGKKFQLTSSMTILLFSELFWGFGFFFYKLSLPGLGWYAATLINTVALAAVMVPFAYIKGDGHAAIKNNLLAPIVFSIFLAVGGTLLYAFGISIERTSIVTPISAMFPLVAIVLGYFFLKEKLQLHQYLGIASVLIGIVLVSV